MTKPIQRLTPRALPPLRILVAYLGLGLASATAQGSSDVPPPPLSVVRDAALSLQRKSWEQGALARAFQELGWKELTIQMVRASLVYRSPDGLPATLGGSPVDPLMLGESLSFAADETEDPELRKAVLAARHFILTTAPRAKDGTLYHLGHSHWSDSFNTTPPFLASQGEFNEALKQVDGNWRRLWDPKANLLAHKWDEDKQVLSDASHWGGGNGWAAASLTRILRLLPKERHQDRAQLVSLLRQLLDGCLKHQMPTGLFHDVIDDESTFEESCLAEMLAYSIFEGVADGWLPDDYLPAAFAMRKGVQAKLDKDGFVQGACGAPDFRRAGISAEAQAFYLMMEAAVAKWNSSTQPKS